MKEQAKRVVYIVIGIVATILAILGVLLPGLPAVVFVLIALWAFAESSPKLNALLHRIPILRTALDQAHEFQTHKAVRYEVKIIAQSFAWGSFIVTLVLTDSSFIYTRIFVFLAAVTCSLFMWWIPTLKSK
jgi:uncharacterized membrane protein YbaN (DUF454 family)